jgi:fructose-1,6-bisphosphatase/sedoheptulose 1,7-bisphosphatase-like protein
LHRPDGQPAGDGDAGAAAESADDLPRVHWLIVWQGAKGGAHSAAPASCVMGEVSGELRTLQETALLRRILGSPERPHQDDLTSQSKGSPTIE